MCLHSLLRQERITNNNNNPLQVKVVNIDGNMQFNKGTCYMSFLFDNISTNIQYYPQQITCYKWFAI